MAKIMLVEDDNNLREIYEARLLAEGYEIVSAKDGEEALALAVKEKPDLIISDVMMPKISGFDMLDILRSTPETKNTKVIMMTALSQAEDKARADKLGADRYLVKSQVTLEDVAKVAKEVLAGEQAPSLTPPPAAPIAVPVPVSEPVAVQAPPAFSAPIATPVDPLSDDTTIPAVAQTTADEAATVADQINQFAATPVDPVTPVAPPLVTDDIQANDLSAPIEVVSPPVSESSTTDQAADSAEKLAEVVSNALEDKKAEEAASASAAGTTSKRVIAPLNDLSSKPDLEKMAAQQDAIDNAMQAVQTPPATSVVDPLGNIATPPQAAAPEAAPQTPDTPTRPGDKVDPNSVAL